MELTLKRYQYDELATLGRLYVDGKLQCFTLELPFVDGRVGTAIPEGRYPVVHQPSPKFIAQIGDPWVQQYAHSMPHVLEIPGRSLIMIHWGNTPANTEGCILVGNEVGGDALEHSRVAFAELYGIIFSAMANDECYLTVARA